MTPRPAKNDHGGERQGEKRKAAEACEACAIIGRPYVLSVYLEAQGVSSMVMSEKMADDSQSARSNQRSAGFTLIRGIGGKSAEIWRLREHLPGGIMARTRAGGDTSGYRRMRARLFRPAANNWAQQIQYDVEVALKCHFTLRRLRRHPGWATARFGIRLRKR